MKQENSESHNIEPTEVKPKKLSQKKRKHTTKSGVVVHLTPAQKKYADTKLANPDMSLSDVAHEAYPNAAPQTLRQLANMNEKNNDITIYTEQQTNQAATTVVEIMNDDTVKADTRLRAADSILDRSFGKATVRTESTNHNLNLNVEASEELNKSFADFLKQQTDPNS